MDLSVGHRAGILHTSDGAENISGGMFHLILKTRLRKYKYEIQMPLAINNNNSCLDLKPGPSAPHLSFPHTMCTVAFWAKTRSPKTKQMFWMRRECRALAWKLMQFGEKKPGVFGKVSWARTETRVVTASSRKSELNHPKILHLLEGWPVEEMILNAW